jgi:flagellar biosynthesis protein FlhB
MKNKEDKNIETLVEKMMKDTSLQITSFDFTSKVMSEVLAIDKKPSVSYKPVISKCGWFIIFAAISGLIIWLIFNRYTFNETTTNPDFSFINTDNILKIFSRFEFSNITTNIILLAITMIFIQIVLLKSYLNQRFHK